MNTEFSDYLFAGDFCRNTEGKIYEVVKVNRVNTVCRDKQGKLWNVRGVLKKTDKPSDWVDVEIPDLRPGMVVHVKKTSGLYGRKFFTQYSSNTFFVVTDADKVKASFVPLGAKGLPANTRGYSCPPDSLEVVDFDAVLANL